MTGARGLVSAALLAATSPLTANPAQPPHEGWTLVWSDEFDGPAIDRTKWSFDVDCWGGGNDERQCYTDRPRNAEIAGGRLLITAHRERNIGPALPQAMRRTSDTPDAEVVRDFSSARLTTKGKAAWRYGRIEVRARLPQGQGTWPAIWMLPEKDLYGSWAASGEIDILEAVNLGVPCARCPGGTENTILATVHFGGQWPANRQAGTEAPHPPVLDEDFHTYAVEWHPDHMAWFVDGIRFAVHRAAEWSTTGSTATGAPFDQPFHLILNLAIGGRLPEGRGVGGVALDGYPRRMEVDWVRVWQRPDAPTGQGGKDQGG